jgi:hypothetical protein
VKGHLGGALALSRLAGGLHPPTRLWGGFVFHRRAPTGRKSPGEPAESATPKRAGPRRAAGWVGMGWRGRAASSKNGACSFVAPSPSPPPCPAGGQLAISTTTVMCASGAPTRHPHDGAYSRADAPYPPFFSPHTGTHRHEGVWESVAAVPDGLEVRVGGGGVRGRPSVLSLGSCISRRAPPPPSASPAPATPPPRWEKKRDEDENEFSPLLQT